MNDLLRVSTRQSTGTGDKLKAQERHHKLKASLWAREKLAATRSRSWNDELGKWPNATCHKATRKTDFSRLRWLDKHLGGVPLDSITRETIAMVSEIKASESSAANANRTLSLIHAILRNAVFDWKGLNRV